MSWWNGFRRRIDGQVCGASAMFHRWLQFDPEDSDVRRLAATLQTSLLKAARVLEGVSPEIYDRICTRCGRFEPRLRAWMRQIEAGRGATEEAE